MKQWDRIDATILKSIPSPDHHVHKITTNEFSVFGAASQPDYAVLTLEFRIAKHKACPELKALKAYLLQYRDCIMSYERAASVLKGHLLEVYRPLSLKVSLSFSPRGGLASEIVTGGS